MASREFIATIAPIIVKEAEKRGYKYPSAIIAQACLESAYGSSRLAYKYHNYFGMKCGSSWKGKAVNMNTSEEYKKGTLTKISAAFRAYDSMEEGVRGYFDFISAVRYNALKNATSARDYLSKIKQAGYATSYSYVESCMKVVIAYDLESFDNGRKKTEYKKDPLDIAKEVIRGNWGNGAERKARLREAGYDYKVIQDLVNELIRRNAI